MIALQCVCPGFTAGIFAVRNAPEQQGKVDFVLHCNGLQGGLYTFLRSCIFMKTGFEMWLKEQS